MTMQDNVKKRKRGTGETGEGIGSVKECLKLANKGVFAEKESKEPVGIKRVKRRHKNRKLEKNLSRLLEKIEGQPESVIRTAEKLVAGEELSQKERKIKEDSLKKRKLDTMETGEGIGSAKKCLKLANKGVVAEKERKEAVESKKVKRRQKNYQLQNNVNWSLEKNEGSSVSVIRTAEKHVANEELSQKERKITSVEVKYHKSVQTFSTKMLGDMKFYEERYKYRRPFRVLLDTAFFESYVCQEETDAVQTIQQLLGGPFIFLYTNCVKRHIRQERLDWLSTLTFTELYPCRESINDLRKDFDCVKDIIKESGINEFLILATGNPVLKRLLRKYSAVPIIYIRILKKFTDKLDEVNVRELLFEGQHANRKMCLPDKVDLKLSTRETIRVLVDIGFITFMLRFDKDIDDISKLLGHPVDLCSTRCAFNHKKKKHKCHVHINWVLCGHKGRLGNDECILSVVEEIRFGCFFVATTSKRLKMELSKIRGVTVISFDHTDIIKENPSAALNTGLFVERKECAIESIESPRQYDTKMSFASNNTEVPPFNTLFLKNLPYSITEKHVYDFFNDVGEIDNVHIATKDGLRLGYAHVKFLTHEAAREGLKYNKRMLQARTIFIEIAKDKRRDWSARDLLGIAFAMQGAVAFCQKVEEELSQKEKKLKDERSNAMKKNKKALRAKEKKEKQGRWSCSKKSKRNKYDDEDYFWSS